MAYTRRDLVAEQQEAHQKSKQITEICEQFHIALDPINWQEHGLQASVQTNHIEIASLAELSQRGSDDILRMARIKLFEHAAIAAVHAQPGTKASIWSPVDVVQPQEFLSLWIITLETGERVPIVESIKNDQRVYAHYTLNNKDVQQLALLFGPASEGEYHLGDSVTIKERDAQYTGEIIYIIPPSKVVSTRKYASRGYHTVAGTAYTNDVAARYIVDCNDGFPHIVNQSQVA